MTLSLEQKIKLLKKQNFKCPHCGRTILPNANRLRDWKKELGYYPDPSVPSKTYFHHKKHRAHGGLDNLENYLATCGRCHAKAHNYYLKYRKTPINEEPKSI